MRIAVSLLAAAAAVFASSSATFASCARDTQVEISACLSAEAGSAQKKLDAAFASAVKRSSGKAKAELVASQKQWVRQRDAACDAEAAEYEGGSMQPSVYSSCMSAAITKRIGVLKGVGH